MPAARANRASRACRERESVVRTSLCVTNGGAAAAVSVTDRRVAHMSGSEVGSGAADEDKPFMPFWAIGALLAPLVFSTIVSLLIALSGRLYPPPTQVAPANTASNPLSGGQQPAAEAAEAAEESDAAPPAAPPALDSTPAASADESADQPPAAPPPEALLPGALAPLPPLAPMGMSSPGALPPIRQ